MHLSALLTLVAAAATSATAADSSFERRQMPNIVPGAMSGNGKPYPQPTSEAPSRDSMPQAWIDRYNAAKAAGKIPDIPPAKLLPSGYTEYPAGTDLNKVCSWTASKCYAPDDIWLAPNNVTAPTVDDGPTPSSLTLIDNLKQLDVKVTHFLIGSAILYNPQAMKAMVDAGYDLQVHTVSHSVQTTKTDMQVLADLGWCMQLIFDWTGKVPMYLRPPTGDIDNRVRAIAKEVFGLQTVMWDEARDASDWCNNPGGAALPQCKDVTISSTVRQQRSWVEGRNRTGFISLNHETSDATVTVLRRYLTTAKQNNWKIGTVANVANLPHYQNQWDLNGPVVKVDSILPVLPAFKLTDGGKSGNAPDLSAWQPIKQGRLSAAAATNPATLPSTNSSTSAAASSNGSSGSTFNGKTSGADSRHGLIASGFSLLSAGLFAMFLL